MDRTIRNIFTHPEVSTNSLKSWMYLLRKRTPLGNASLLNTSGLVSDQDLFKSKGVAHALQRLNAERALSRASTLNNPFPLVNSELAMGMYGRDSVLSGRPPSSMNQYPSSTPISSFGIARASQHRSKIRSPTYKNTVKRTCCRSTSKPKNANQIQTTLINEDCKRRSSQALFDVDRCALFPVDRYRSWVILDNEDTKISDVYAYTVVDARRRASQRALEALMKKQPSHVNRWTAEDDLSFPFLLA